MSKLHGILQEGGSGAAEDGDEMVLPKLDGFFGDVVVVIVQWYELVSHAGGKYCLFIFIWCFIV